MPDESEQINVSVRALRRGTMAAKAAGGGFTLTGPTLLTEAATGNNQTIYTTASVTPSANALVLVWVMHTGTTGAPSSVVGNGITYSQAATAPEDIALTATTLFYGSAASPSAGTIAITFPAGRTGCIWRVEEWAGSPTPTVKQTKTGVDSAGTSAAVSLTLDSVPAASSAVVLGVGKRLVATVTPGGGFTGGLTLSHSGPDNQGFTEYDIGPVDAVADCSWSGNAFWAAVAAEIGAP